MKRLLIALLLGGSSVSAQVTLSVNSAGNLNAGFTVPSGRGVTFANGSTLNLQLAQVQALLDLMGTTRGSVIYRGASGWTVLTPGTSGTFLRSQGPGADPAFASVPGGGDMLAANNLSDLANITTARTNLGAQTLDSDLTALAAIATTASARPFLAGVYTANQMGYYDGTFWQPTTTSSAGRAVMNATSQSAAGLGLTNGTTIDAWGGVTDSAGFFNRISDETGGSGTVVRSGGPTINNGTFAISMIQTGALITPANPLAAFVVNVASRWNTKSISAPAPTFTFSATPATDTWFALKLTETGGAARTVTIPSSFDDGSQTTRTTFTLPANQQVTLWWHYDGSAFIVYGIPATIADLVDLAGAPASNDLFEVFDVSAGFSKFVSAANLLSGVSVTDTTAVHKATSGEISVMTQKSALASGDNFLIEDSAASDGKKRTTAGNINTFVASATKTLTNTTYDTAGTGNSFSINGVAATANTGTGAVARATSPTFVTPVLGAATATTINGAGLTGSATVTANAALTVTQAVALNRQASTGLPVEFMVACSDLTTAITAGTTKGYFRAPYAFTLTEVRASVLTAPTGATILIDVNESATTVLSTKLMIDATESTSQTAATAYVISDSAIADDAVLAIDFDQVGSTIAGGGVIVTLKGYR